MDDETPPSTSYFPGNHQATPTDNKPISDSHRTLPYQIEASSEIEGTDNEVNVDTGEDSLLLGELMVGKEMIKESGGGGGGRGERRKGEPGERREGRRRWGEGDEGDKETTCH